MNFKDYEQKLASLMVFAVAVKQSEKGKKIARVLLSEVDLTKLIGIKFSVLDFNQVSRYLYMLGWYLVRTVDGKLFMFRISSTTGYTKLTGSKVLEGKRFRLKAKVFDDKTKEKLTALLSDDPII